ncbi:MAG: hypothetical protein U5L02_16435 [Rheinheimera sp.]|nr:hypothetical protein [Rheinheimera sp.]
MNPIKYNIQNIPLAVALAALKDLLVAEDARYVSDKYRIGIRTVYQLKGLAEQGTAATAEAPLTKAWETQGPLAVFHLPQLDSLNGILELLQSVQRHQETDHHNHVLALVLLPGAATAADALTNSQATSEHRPAMPLSDGRNQPVRG